MNQNIILKPEIKNMWVEALRSGKYRQGNGALRNEHNEFCCLGVLCDLVAPDKWTESDIKGINNEKLYASYDDEGLLPRRIVEQIAVSGSIQRNFTVNLCGGPDKGVVLSELNDNGYTFNQLADIIEKHL